MNPCPCGHLGDPQHSCRCSDEQIARYRSKLSGPLLDRIDLFIEVPAVPAESLRDKASGESSAQVRQRVIAARERQHARQGKANAALTSREIDHFCTADADATRFLHQAMTQLAFSARAWHRILRVARTLADLADKAEIATPEIAEAIHYRRFTRA